MVLLIFDIWLSKSSCKQYKAAVVAMLHFSLINPVHFSVWGFGFGKNYTFQNGWGLAMVGGQIDDRVCDRDF